LLYRSYLDNPNPDLGGGLTLDGGLNNGVGQHIDDLDPKNTGLTAPTDSTTPPGYDPEDLGAGVGGNPIQDYINNANGTINKPPLGYTTDDLGTGITTGTDLGAGVGGGSTIQDYINNATTPPPTITPTPTPARRWSCVDNPLSV